MSIYGAKVQTTHRYKPNPQQFILFHHTQFWLPSSDDDHVMWFTILGHCGDMVTSCDSDLFTVHV